MTLLREMASNPASPYRVELGHVDDLHARDSASEMPDSAQVRPVDASATVVRLHGKTVAKGETSKAPASQISPRKQEESVLEELPPFARLAARQGRPLRVAILSDFTRIPYANGAAFQTRFLYQELRRCGHEVTVIGPHDPDARPEELAPGTVSLPSLPLKTYPGVHIPLPLASWVYDADRWNFDIVFAQTTSLLVEFGLWLRRMKGIPLLIVNTTHLAAAYDVLLPEKLSKIEAVHGGLEMFLRRPYEELFASIYNESDGLVVLSEGLRRYWRERGVTAPIHVIPRAVQPEMFDKPLGADPYEHLGNGRLSRGPRLLCAGRHTREKSQDRLIRIFARHIAKAEPDATLTLLGQGPDTEYYKRVAVEQGVADRVFFPGEVPFSKMADYYAYADLFLHASLSETYGNVMGEALWCGTPTVAFADGMGVSAQIQDGVNGVLLAPGNRGAGVDEADEAFARATLGLIRDPKRRGRLGQTAAKVARERAHPRVVEERIADAFQHAQDHAAACGLRPVAERPKALQWYTTFRYFRPWTTFMGGLYLFGHLRPAKESEKQKKTVKHPQIST
ncbi:glycosyltransferase [Pendulispora brunnea]|uniref:Glycosyltransferase n=1 Tax=Pendulispora brunnea TaxID=2905690 RepID=A0ABZ2KLR6_9BACT